MAEEAPLLAAPAPPLAPPSAASPAGRNLSIDLLKAGAIIVVVLEHASRPNLFLGVSLFPSERFIGNLSGACTPIFLFSSAYLAAARPLPCATLARALRRLLLPYVIAELLTRASLPSLLQLLCFTSRGIHYYVALAVGCALCLPLLSRLASHAWTVAAAALCLRLAAARLPLPLELAFRLPSFGLWAFAAGFAARVSPPRPALLPLLLPPLLLWLYDLPYRCPAAPAALALHDAAGLAAALALALGATARPPPAALGAHPLVRALSSHSYTVYLYHISLIEAHSRLLLAPRGVSDASEALLPWVPMRFALGMGGGMGVALLGVAIFGSWARDLLGAGAEKAEDGEAAARGAEEAEG
ncbi:hypothetical protein AB1Y20_010340 [Prymnesium parvum]|uniref:Acyltransferase 3 domain-containing protein n=1 Tax=Prymnesium parvum TaxID=97485 RepID=A0AB34K441_PRYPA